MNTIAENKHSELIEISSLRTDGGTQPRAAIFQNVIDDYADAMQAGATFPPVVVYYDGTEYWLADGFHRHAAHRKIGHAEIAADIRQGTRRDAVLHSVGANASHGLRRTNEDKRRAVTTLLQDAEWAGWSNMEIARRCGVSHTFVQNTRPILATVASMAPPERTFVHPRTGQPTTMDTARIGRAAPEIRQTNEPVPPALDAPAVANDNSPAAYRTSFTGNNEWYTPAKYIDLARQVMGSIDVDPASNDYAQKTVRAAAFFTAETNGLDKEWRGKVWMNPPYSQPEIVHFVDKIVAEVKAGNCSEAIVLTHNSTDTAWFNTLFENADAICFTRGRVRFESPDGEKAAPAMGQAFTYFGANPEKFTSIFSEIGNVWGPKWRNAA